eukprot:gnl/MRDRNA2_/MRDRNA2_65885_c0_seq1.p1 gnl/MRDRNA2_/MRDRNA2_65885_c0~~gnl/MRDRNA2_/MRDRNA2_65885_c0_seq1.p1  ORF type:complete len:407 (-),score=47.72 gnl/MRDRNA2_/MRDRNA2_65885_c0_seq1:71-1255(-)
MVLAWGVHVAVCVSLLVVKLEANDFLEDLEKESQSVLHKATQALDSNPGSFNFYLYPPRFKEEGILSIWYDRFYKLLEQHPWRTTDPEEASVFFLGIDVACGFLWPVYAGGENNYVVGDRSICWKSRDERLQEYVSSGLATHWNATGKRHIVFDLLGWQLPKPITHSSNMVSLAAPSLPYTIYRKGVDLSWPTLPVTIEDQVNMQSEQCTPRKRLAVFKGTKTHPLRTSLEELHNGDDIVVELQNFKRETAAASPSSDPTKAHFAQLMRESDFALIPRGDNLFSVRLTESLSFGAIPVILANNWVLPFESLIDWSEMSVVVNEADYLKVPSILQDIGSAKRCEMRRRGKEMFDKYLRDLEGNVRGMMEILAARHTGASRHRTGETLITTPRRRF